jgi:hypothetical protein
LYVDPASIAFGPNESVAVDGTCPKVTGGVMRFSVVGAISEFDGKVAIHQTSSPEFAGSIRTSATGQAGVQLNVTEVPTEIVASTDDVWSEQLAPCGAVPSPEHDTTAIARTMAPRVRCLRVI